MAIKFADTTKVVTKSTAARKDVQSASYSREGVVEAILGDKLPDPEAGTQALPVDTHSKAMFDRNKYQRDYMNDQRTIKRLGLGISVKEYRSRKG